MLNVLDEDVLETLAEAFTMRTLNREDDSISIKKSPSRTPGSPPDEQVDILDGIKRQKKTVDEAMPKWVVKAEAEVNLEADVACGALPCATEAEMDTDDADTPSADYLWEFMGSCS